MAIVCGIFMHTNKSVFAGNVGVDCVKRNYIVRAKKGRREKKKMQMCIRASVYVSTASTAGMYRTLLNLNTI